MHIAVTGASGLIGTELLPHLVRGGHSIVRLVRRPGRGTEEVQWDPMAGDASGIAPGALDGVDAVVHLAGAGVGDKRWTESYKALIRDSRVLGTRTLVSAMTTMAAPPAAFVSGSAVGYYGDRDEEVLTEESSRGSGFLADVVAAWEAEAVAAEAAGIRTVRLRTGLVMSDRGGAFGRLLKIFKLGGGGPIAGGRQWWPWITLLDEVRAIDFCLRSEIRGPVNLGSPSPRRNADVADALGRALHRPAFVPVPGFALRVALGEFASDVTGSQRMLPNALLAAGFAFTHTDIDQACRWLVDR